MEKLLAMIPAEKRHILSKMQGLTAGQKVLMPSFWKGYRFIPGFEAETAKYVYEKYEVEKDSVFIITFPKTGTTWCGEVVRQIMYGGDEKLNALTKSFPPPLFALEIGPAEKYQLLDHIPLPRKLFISHLPEELVNMDKIKKSDGKVIIVIRNPKDQAVSWFHFAQTNPMFKGIRDEVSSDWEEFLSYYMQGKQPLISKEGEWYPDHILGWYKHKDDPNVLFVHFEDMKRDLKKEIRRMATFIDVNLDDERVNSIAESTTFSSMKKRTEAKNDTVSKLRANFNMMRKGQVGGWKDEFTVAQSELMDMLIEDKLGKTDIKFTYEL